MSLNTVLPRIGASSSGSLNVPEFDKRKLRRKSFDVRSWSASPTEDTNSTKDMFVTTERSIFESALKKASRASFSGATWYADACGRIHQLTLPENIDEDDVPPNEQAVDWSLALVSVLNKENKPPYRVLSDTEGGIMFAFFENGKQIDLVVANSGLLIVSQETEDNILEHTVGELSYETLSAGVKIICDFLK
ncbi:MAG: hypothetical protein KF836_07720 [Fimbriimonadaceae bacterium]|nr:hypothetical protein [Fimbriimonadaceae bacterium]